MESESGSRSSQESNLVSAFRPVAGRTQRHDRLQCSPAPSIQPGLENCSPANPWESPAWNKWLQSCKQMHSFHSCQSVPHGANRTCKQCNSPQTSSISRPGVNQSQGVYQCPTQCKFMSQREGDHNIYDWEMGDESLSCADNHCPIGSGTEMAVMPILRQSRSVESLLEVHRASSSSVSMVSIGAIDVEGVPSYCSRKSLGTTRGPRDGCDIAGQFYNLPPNARSLTMSSQRLGSTSRQRVGDNQRPCEIIAVGSASGQAELGQTSSNIQRSTNPCGPAPAVPLQRSGQEYRADAWLLRSGSTIGFVADSSLYHLDPYGFFVDSCLPGIAPSAPRRTPLEISQEERKMHRWKIILNTRNSWWDISQGVKFGMLKRQVRRGIPDEMRGQAWFALSGGRELKSANPGVYDLLLKENSDAEHDIRRDLHRTFPNHVFYQQEGGSGQQALLNVLKAYAIHDPEVCYVQGMGRIVAVLLLYMKQEEAFWTFAAMMKPPISSDDQLRYRRGIRALFLNELPLCRKLTSQFEYLLSKKLSRLSESLKDECYEPAMYATKWWMALFSLSLPFSHVVRVWDIFMLEGWKMGIRVGLAIMKALEKHLLGHSFESIIEHNTPEFLGAVINPTDEFIRVQTVVTQTDAYLASIRNRSARAAQWSHACTYLQHAKNSMTRTVSCAPGSELKMRT